MNMSDPLDPKKAIFSSIASQISQLASHRKTDESLMPDKFGTESFSLPNPSDTVCNMIDHEISVLENSSQESQETVGDFAEGGSAENEVDDTPSPQQIQHSLYEETTMSQQKLRMKYHPAKKELEFKRIGTNGKEIPIKRDSVLHNHTEKKKGKFVLQDHGNAFFEDIAKAFDGEQTVEIEVVTTQKDFEDFEAMAEHYNKDPNKKVTISTMLCERLPDMNDTYRVVAEHGEKAIRILEKHRSTFSEISQKESAVKESVERFSSIVQGEVDNIREKIKSLGDSRVNLCFAGVYSAGKSALINAILGYRILPEAMKSTTARMFTIQSPKVDESVRIVFDILDENDVHHTDLQWNAQSKTFQFFAGPSENKTREFIQETINKHQAERQHCQIYEILTTLNSKDLEKDIADNIKVFFPIPLDDPHVQFTIFDTPGTDSNFGEHQCVLQSALAEQTHSILVFVAAPTRLEGEGNNALLTYLKEAEKNVSKTTIDIGRSLFVINHADGTTSNQRLSLKSAEIIQNKSDINDGEFSISLSDKKLFFTSAAVAYAAQAKKNGIAEEEQEDFIELHSGSINKRTFGCYYKQNHVATSEYATQKQIACCDAALEKAEKKEDVHGILHICSGLFALENEIKEYGEKFATAVRAFAIIRSVDKALTEMNRQAAILKRGNQENIDKIEKEIKELKTTLTNGFREAREKYDIKTGEKLSPDLRKRLNLDADSLREGIVKPATTGIWARLGAFLRKYLLGPTPQKDHKIRMIQTITSVLNDFTDGFRKNRQKELEKACNSFLEDVKTVIQSNGAISTEAKEFFLDIPAPTVKPSFDLSRFQDIYDSKKRAWLFWNYVDINGITEESIKELAKIAAQLCDEFAEDYRKALTDILSKVEARFKENLTEYSTTMNAKLQDKAAMEQFRIKIAAAADELKSCQDELNTKIWSVKFDE